MPDPDIAMLQKNVLIRTVFGQTQIGVQIDDIFLIHLGLRNNIHYPDVAL
jgi:hypothetical protein